MVRMGCGTGSLPAVLGGVSTFSDSKVEDLVGAREYVAP